MLHRPVCSGPLSGVEGMACAAPVQRPGVRSLGLGAGADTERRRGRWSGAVLVVPVKAFAGQSQCCGFGAGAEEGRRYERRDGSSTGGGGGGTRCGGWAVVRDHSTRTISPPPLLMAFGGGSGAIDGGGLGLQTCGAPLAGASAWPLRRIVHRSWEGGGAHGLALPRGRIGRG